MHYSHEYDKEIEKIVEAYEPMQDKYADFAVSIRQIIETLLKKYKFGIYTARSRAKGLDSLRLKLRKIEEDKKECYYIEKPVKGLDDIKDLAGVRVIFYIPKFEKQFEKILYEESDLEIKRKPTIKDGGYRATHLYVKLKKDRLSLPEYKDYEGLKCEVQLTNVLDHGWSEVERILYKPSGGDIGLSDSVRKKISNTLQETKKTYIDQANLRINHVNDLAEGDRVAFQFLSNENLETIYVSSSNNEIYDLLEGLEKILKKTINDYGGVIPDNVNLDFFKKIIAKAHENVYVDEDTIIGTFPGKKEGDIFIKILDIIEFPHFLYNNHLEVFDFLIDTYGKQNKESQLKIIEVIKKMSEYNIHILNRFGIAIQSTIVNKINEFDIQNAINLIEIILIAYEEILKTDVRGFEHTAVDTFSLRQGTLTPTDSLKKMRRQIIDNLLIWYKRTEDIQVKLKILHTLRHLITLPNSTINEDTHKKIVEMIFDDVKYLIGKYEQILFNRNKLVAEFPIVQEIEAHFFYFELNENIYREKVPEVWNLLRSIRANSEYKIYRTFINERTDYHPITNSKKTSSQTRKNGRESVKTIAKKLNKKNIDIWLKRIKKIAKYSDFVEEWKYTNFRQFLVDIGHYAPIDMITSLLDESLETDSPLHKYTFEFLWGLRCNKEKLHLWNRYTKKIIDSHPDILSSVYGSLYIINDNLTEYDVQLLDKIVFGKKPFISLDKVCKENKELRFNIFRALLKLLNTDVKKACELIKVEMVNFPQYRNIYFDQLWPFLHSMKDDEIKQVARFLRNFIFSQIVEIKRIDYDTEILLLKLSSMDLEPLIKVFEKRIKKAVSLRKKEKKVWTISDQYDPIPFNINHELSQFVISHKDYKKVITGLIERMYKPGRSYEFKFETGQLLNLFPSDKNEEIILSFINKNDKTNLQVALILMHRFTSEPNFNLCVEFVKKANLIKHKKLLDELWGIMSQTGVVSGWNGLAEAYKGKAERLAKIASENKDNSKVSSYFEKVSKSFAERAKEEQRRSEEERALREIEFNSKI